MEKESALLGVIKNDLPLVELGNVVVQLFVARDEGPDVVAVAAGVVGEEGNGVAPNGGNIIDCTDEAFALANLPGGIADLPICFVRFVFMKGGLGRFASAGGGIGF